MSEYNRKEQLKALHNNRKLDTRKKIDEAIKQLTKEKKFINFNSISKKSGVSKSTLYNNMDIKLKIEELRSKQGCNQTYVKKNMNKNNIEATISVLKRKIKKLELENKSLSG